MMDGRSQQPIFKGQRFVVFAWQLEDLMRLLGKQTDAFDLHAFFYALDAHVLESGEVIPQRDGGKWLQTQVTREAERRGLLATKRSGPIPMVSGTQPYFESCKAHGHIPPCPTYIAHIRRCQAQHEH